MLGCRAWETKKKKVDTISSHFFTKSNYFFLFSNMLIFFMTNLDIIIYINNHRHVERQWQIEYLTNGDNKVAGRYQNHYLLRHWLHVKF